jgi:hypothetical protein
MTTERLTIQRRNTLPNRAIPRQAWITQFTRPQIL